MNTFEKCLSVWLVAHLF